MAQADGVVANGTGSAVRSDINNQYAALWSNHSGSTEPSSGKVAYQFWADTNTNILKIRNSGNSAWISLFTLAGGVDVDAASNFNEDVTFTGASANAVWDKSDNALEFADNAKCTFGASDLSLYHDGSNSYLDHNGTGSLYIRTVGTDEDITIQAEKDLYLKVAAGETAIKAIENSNVSLYFDNSKKLETSSAGVTVIGDLLLDNSAHAGSDILWDQSSKALEFADGVGAVFGNGDDLQIYHDGSHSFITNSTGDLVLGYSNIYLQPVTGENGLRSVANGTTELYFDAVKKFETSSTGIKIHGLSTGTGNSDLRYSSSDGVVTYDTSSRLVKTDIEDSPYGLDVLKQLRPRKYKRTDLKDTPIEIGFVADEVQPLIPEIVPTGPKSIFTKDDLDKEIIPVNVDYRKLTVVLTTALKEAITKIETLETKVAALEAK